MSGSFSGPLFFCDFGKFYGTGFGKKSEIIRREDKNKIKDGSLRRPS